MTKSVENIFTERILMIALMLIGKAKLPVNLALRG
jgi:hypothetical protein